MRRKMTYDRPPVVSAVPIQTAVHDDEGGLFPTLVMQCNDNNDN